MSPVAFLGTCAEALRFAAARLFQTAEGKALNLVVVGSSPAVGAAAQKHKSLAAELDMPGQKPMGLARCKQ